MKCEKTNPEIIFDLSEVLIYGLVGVEKSLAASLNLPETEILKCFGGEQLHEKLIVQSLW